MAFVFRNQLVVLTLLGTCAAVSACESSKAPKEAEPSGPSGSSNVAAFAAPARVEVTAAGFRPTRVVVGSDHQVTFKRTSDATCATSVVFPALGIKKALPLNTDVVVDLPPSAPHELTFQCGMGMHKSTAVID